MSVKAILAGQGSGGTETFEAIYGTTTSAEIEAAYQKGQDVVCKYGGRIYPLTSRTSATIHYFSIGAVEDGSLIGVNCNNNTWSLLDMELAPIASPALTGTPTAPTAAAGTNTTQLATTAFVQAAVATYVRPNLLDNGYFVGGGSQQGGGQFPVNHRGATVYNSYGYAIDRWMLDYQAPATNKSVTLTATGIAIANSGTNNLYFRQETGALPSATYTVSILASNVVGSPSFQVRQNGSYTTAVTIEDGLTSFTVTGPIERFNLNVHVSESVNLISVKLELGDTQTLAHQENGVWVLNEIPNYNEQLFRCQTSTADPTDTFANKTNLVGFQVKPNLLDNWYFVGGGSQQGGGQFPINTRGQTSYSGANTDTIDEWGLVSAHTVNIVPAGLKLTVSSSAVANYILAQIVGNLDTGLTYTLSALIVENTTTTGAVVRFDNKISAPLLGTGLISLTFQPSSDSIGLGVYNKANDNGSYYVVAAMKLELGDTQTLAHQENGVWVLNEIPNYNEQMLRCNDRLTYGSTDLTAGTSSLTTGVFYAYYT